MKEEIITGQLPPGSIISELLLAKRYQTSRTPVREACQFLQKDGLLEAVPHKGFFVAEITMTQIQELEALARPITFTASNQQSFRRSSELNHRFHLRIAEITGNVEMIKILSNILDKITRAQYLEAKMAPMIIGPEHEEIVRAIKGRDPDAAEKAMVAHIQSSLDRLLHVIFSSK